MSTPTTTRPAEAALAPLTLCCPYCGAQEAGIAVLLAQLDCQQFRCEECSVEFSIDDVQAIIAPWQRLISWVRSAPQFPASE